MGSRVEGFGFSVIFCGVSLHIASAVGGFGYPVSGVGGSVGAAEDDKSEIHKGPAHAGALTRLVRFRV